MPKTMKKDQAHKLIDNMPENSSWDGLMHKIYVREIIEEGLADSEAGRTKSVQEVRKEYDLDK